MHHAYLFTGTRGVGKTTIARIFAKSLNCERGQSADPCGECSACTAVDEGRFVDLLEIDAASNTGVDDVREVIENAQYAPSRGRFKVYLVDEVHMLSKSAFNALLKTLEEPPPHVKFLLATTDPQKLPVTVLSRCLKFNLKRLLPEQISGQMRHILAAESIATKIRRSANWRAPPTARCAMACRCWTRLLPTVAGRCMRTTCVPCSAAWRAARYLACWMRWPPATASGCWANATRSLRTRRISAACWMILRPSCTSCS